MLKFRLFYQIAGISILAFSSCNPLKDYFKDPEPDPLVETIHAATLTGYAISAAMGKMDGAQPSDATDYQRNIEGFPCVTQMTLSMEDDYGYPFLDNKASHITVVGLWSDPNTAIFSLLFTNYSSATQTISFLGIQTVPAIRDGNNIEILLATQDVRLNPDQDALFSLNLNTFEFTSELLKLDLPRPNDVYVAVEQSAYFIDVNTNGTLGIQSDDRYIICGGGQLIEVQNNSTEIVQQAMIDVRINPVCNLCPISGNSILRVIDVEDHSLPELGTAVFEFNDDCEADAHIYVATGIYAGANGKNIPFRL
jgi:hypothetical protein